MTERASCFISASSLLREMQGDYEVDDDQDEFDLEEEFEQSSSDDVSEHDECGESDAVPTVSLFCVSSPYTEVVLTL